MEIVTICRRKNNSSRTRELEKDSKDHTVKDVFALQEVEELTKELEKFA